MNLESDVIQRVMRDTFIRAVHSCFLMPMTHIQEISAEKPYEKTDTINRHENRACPIVTRN